MNLKTFLLITLFFVGIIQTKAQFDEKILEKDTLELDIIDHLEQDSNSWGKINIYQDKLARDLLKIDKNLSSKNPVFDGYRIQIFSGRSEEKENALAVKQRFEKLYPNIRAYLIYQTPDFKVRVGNFRTKIESVRSHKSIKRHFPKCYMVKTKINFLELTNPLLTKEKIEKETNETGAAKN